MLTITSSNPSTNEVIGEVTETSFEEVKDFVNLARGASANWRNIGLEKRIELLNSVADEFVRRGDEIARLTSLEMGRPISEALPGHAGDVEYFRSYMNTAENHLKPLTTLETDTQIHELTYEPYGVAACIAPWNFPFSNWVWLCGQNLVAGNTVVFKHSEETPLCGKLIEEIVNSILPEGVFNEIYGSGAAGQALIEQDVDLICFTGSTSTGSKINESAAKRFIPTVLELGGSAPGIVFEDADVEAVIATIYGNRFSCSGQMCDALKRLIVHESRVEEVTAGLKKIISELKVGDASDRETTLGPLVSHRQLETLKSQVADAVLKGAQVVTGGKTPDGLKGSYYEATLLRGVTSDMRVMKEEVFGPVLPIVTFTQEAEAIRIANDTIYGLGAYIFTTDNERFARVSKQIESGMVSQNNLSYVNTCNPFGGYKSSGNGREHAQFGFHEVTRTKIVAREK